MRFESLETRQLLAADILFQDSFETGANSNDWQGLWVESGGDDWLRSTKRSIDGIFSAELKSGGDQGVLTIASPIDLTGYFNVELSFSWYIEGTFDGSDSMGVEISGDGISWARMATLAGNRAGAEDNWQDVRVSVLPEYLSSSFQFRFVGQVDHISENGNIDAVRLVGTPVGPIEVSITGVTVTEGDDTYALLDTYAGMGARSMVAGPSNLNGEVDHFLMVNVGDFRVLKVPIGPESQTAVEFIPAGFGGMQSPRSVVLDPNEQFVYVVGDSGIWRFDAHTGDAAGIDGIPGNATYIAQGTANIVIPNHVAFDANGDMYVPAHVDLGNTYYNFQILKFAGANTGGRKAGEFIEVFVDWQEWDAASQGKYATSHIDFGPDGHLYAVLSAGNSILRFNGVDGSLLPSAGNSGATFIASGIAGLSSPRSMYFQESSDGQVNLYVASSGSGAILNFDLATGNYVDTLLNNPVEHTYLSDFVAIPDGTFYVSSGSDAVTSRKILRYGPASWAVFHVGLTSPSAEQVSIDLQTIDGSAKSTGGVGEDDYNPLSLTLVFAPGETEKTVVIPTRDDIVVEGKEIFTVELTNAFGAVIVIGQADGTILDNDQPNVGSPNDIYVWDIDFTLVRRGRNTDLRLLVDVNRDSNANGMAEAGDANAAGVTVKVELRNSLGTLVDTLFLTSTNGDGVYQSNWIKGLPPADYTVEVVDLIHGSYDWNQLAVAGLSDLDGDGKPDDMVRMN